MLDLSLRPRSPFASLPRDPAIVGPQPPGLAIAEATPAAMIALSARGGREEALAERAKAALGLDLPSPLTFAAGAGAKLVWTQPGQWLALGEAGLEQRLAAALGDAVSLIDASCGRAVIAVAGPRAEAALQKLLPIDLDPRAFAPNAAATTVAAYLTVQIWRLGPEAFELAVGRSFAVSLWRALIHAGEEYGIAQDFSGPSTRRPSAGGSR